MWLPGDTLNDATVHHVGDVYNDVIKTRLAVPRLNDVIIATCVHVTRTTAVLHVIAIERTYDQVYHIPVLEPFKAILRHIDIREIDRNDTIVPHFIHKGDICRAIVLSHGHDSVYVSTAHRHLGVLYAKGSAGWMTVINHTTVQDPTTGSQHTRKMAIQ